MFACRAGVRAVAAAAAGVRGRVGVRGGLEAAAATTTTVRGLHVHEYLSQEIMGRYGITTPRNVVAETPDAALEQYQNHFGEGNDVVVKAQVLAGGRGLGHFTSGFEGGVHVCTTPGDVYDCASKMLGFHLVTKQTTEEGLLCNKVMLAERLYTRREMYVSIVMDRAHDGPVMVASAEGGTSIEDLAEKSPELIIQTPIDIFEGLSEEKAADVATKLGFEDGSELHTKCRDVLLNLYRMFLDTDATMLEVNPLTETPDGRVLVTDAKLNFDDNAAFRQKDIHKLRDLTQEDAREVEASQADLNYIGLDGNIGCMVNGAGLAMATMDLIKLHGGSPANFLDVGGGATEEQVQQAFQLLSSDPKVKCILVNIFGGIMRCDVIALGIVNAAKKLNMSKPIVIRLQGTNVEEATTIIEGSGFRMILSEDLDDAATKAVSVADIVRQAEEAHLGVTFEGEPSFLPL